MKTSARGFMFHLRAPGPRTAAIALTLSVSALPAVAHAAGPAPTTALYERTLMGRAGARCHLFRPDILFALGASATQARGAAVRAGVAYADIAGAESRARTVADTVACDNHDLIVAADKLRTVFMSYAELRSMSFPGQFADWRAERPHLAVPGKPTAVMQWNLLQFAPIGEKPTMFGLVSAQGGAPFPPGLTLVSPKASAMTATTARLILRDPAKTDQPYIDNRRPGLAGRTPPRLLDQVFLASAKYKATVQLLPPGVRQGEAFVFPEAAAAAIAQLDPREAVRLDIVYETLSGERAETAVFEVGDFAAARAFLAIRLAPRAARK
ncbi:MAG: hypothetical protein ACYDD1_21810 [Caulobacteraceae bacterium]